MNQEIIGYLAAFFTTVAFIPQVYKIFKTNQTEDISLALFVTFCLGVVLWLVYGILLSSMPMIFANSVTLSLTLYILYKIISNKFKQKTI